MEENIAGGNGVSGFGESDDFPETPPGTETKKRGRPKGSTNSAKNKPKPEAPKIDCEALAKVLCQTIEGLSKASVKVKARSCQVDDEVFVSQVCSSLEFNDDEKKTVATALAVILPEYKVDPVWIAWGSILTIIGIQATKIYAAHETFNQIAPDKA